MGTNGLNSICSGNVTDTTGKQGSPEEKLVVIMILVFLMTFLLVFLAVFGAWRRKSRSSFWKVALWISYTTSAALVPFILGLIQEVPFKNDLIILWAMLLFIVFAFPDSFSAYSPEDVKQWRMHYIQFLSKFLALVLLWLRVHSENSLLDLKFMCFFTLIVSLKIMKRSIANVFASPPSIEERAKLSEVCMTSKRDQSKESDIDTAPFTTTGYIVDVPGFNILTLGDVLSVTPSDPSYLTKLIERKNVITLEKVWKCQGKLLKERDRDNSLKDICLSYSLLRILYLKFADYAFPKEAKHKARELILEGLLTKDVNRAFRVIEVELKLLYELIYTNYPLYAWQVFAVLRVLEYVLSLAFCGLSAAYISKHDESLKRVPFDVLVTYVLLGMIAFAEYAQVWMIFSSEWVKAALIFHYVANKDCHNNTFFEKIIKKVGKPWLWKPWARELGQYSLIESRSYGTKPLISAIASTINPDKNWDWQEERKAVWLSDEVKKAVLDSLRTNGYNLENVRRSLRESSIYEELPGVRKCEHEAQVILVWHIATSYCKHKSSDPCLSSNKNYQIVNDLSNYLAYLVAFVPRLLTGPYFEPQFQFRRVMKEAREEFKGCKKVEEKIRKLDQLSMKQDQTVIVLGAKLGKELLQLGEVEVWKILAEFWSDMALYAATSGEVRAHLEKLANGGEFITHLWALLHHTGYSPRTRLDSRDEASTVEDN